MSGSVCAQIMDRVRILARSSLRVKLGVKASGSAWRFFVPHLLFPINVEIGEGVGPINVEIGEGVGEAWFANEEELRG